MRSLKRLYGGRDEMGVQMPGWDAMLLYGQVRLVLGHPIEVFLYVARYFAIWVIVIRDAHGAGYAL
jgi:hypothetical protein